MIFLKLFWKEIGIALIIFVCAITVGITRAQLKSCRADLIATKAQVVILSSTIERQNLAAKKLQDDTKTAHARASKAIKQAKALYALSENKINAANALKTLPRGTCENRAKIIHKALEIAE